MSTLKVTGAPRVHATGAQRDANGTKGRFDLIPPRAMREVAIHYQHGAEVRGERNWERGMPLSWFLDSALRHVYAILEGRTDERHDRAAAWNLMSFIETRARIEAGLLPASLNDLPTLEPPAKDAAVLVGDVLGVPANVP